MYIDGVFFCGLDAFTVLERRLKVGGKISERELMTLVMDEEKNSAYNCAAKRLGYSLLTEKEFKAYLFGRRYLSEAVEYAAEKLKEYGYLGDCAYVKAYFNTYSEGRGDRGICYELERKGIDVNILEDFFAALGTDDSERCRAVAEKYMRGKVITDKTRAALIRHLYSRGFAWESAEPVIAGHFDRSE